MLLTLDGEARKYRYQIPAPKRKEKVGKSYTYRNVLLVGDFLYHQKPISFHPTQPFFHCSKLPCGM